MGRDAAGKVDSQAGVFGKVVMSDVKCNQCGWFGDYADQKYVTVCSGEDGCCTEPECPECGSSWPMAWDDVIPSGRIENA